MTEDDAPTPQIQLKATALEEGDLVAYLTSPPTDAEQVLAERLGYHIGAHVPLYMLARLALLLRRHASWIASRIGVERIVKRAVRAGLVTLGANVALIAGFAYHRAETSGAEREHAANVDKRIDKLEKDVEWLRDQVWKRFGLSPPADLGIVLGSILPTHLSDDDLITPMGCEAPCTNSAQCDTLSNCRNCYLGKCSAVLPAKPVTDAGVDAPAPTSP